jgi:hypothetical protein
VTRHADPLVCRALINKRRAPSGLDQHSTNDALHHAARGGDLLVQLCDHTLHGVIVERRRSVDMTSSMLGNLRASSLRRWTVDFVSGAETSMDTPRRGAHTDARGKIAAVLGTVPGQTSVQADQRCRVIDPSTTITTTPVIESTTVARGTGVLAAFISMSGVMTNGTPAMPNESRTRAPAIDGTAAGPDHSRPMGDADVNVRRQSLERIINRVTHRVHSGVAVLIAAAPVRRELDVHFEGPSPLFSPHDPRPELPPVWPYPDHGCRA